MEALRQGLKTNVYSNKFIIITYKDQLAENEKMSLDSLTGLLGNNDAFEYILNPIEPHSDFTTPVDYKRAMRALFIDYKFPGTNDPQDLYAIERYYQNLSEKYGFDIKIPEHGLVHEGDKFVSADSLEQASEIFLKMEELYPESLMAFDRLGTVAYKKGEFKKAIAYYKKFLDFEPDNPYAKAMLEKIEASMSNK